MEAVNNRKKWIDAGYELFSASGPQALNVERLSLLVGLNRSSFYHYFGDIDMYERELLNEHIDRFELLSTELKQCQSFDPEMLHLVKGKPLEIKFHRQLLVNESTPRYIDCFKNAKSHTEQTAFHLWSKFSELGSHPDAEFNLFETVRDYSLLHFEQAEDEKITSMLHDVKLLMFLRSHFDHDKLNMG
ncbi:MAG: helix-turn-helix domain-containing protein [Cyclobacteriaceae bacterium]